MKKTAFYGSLVAVALLSGGAAAALALSARGGATLPQADIVVDSQAPSPFFTTVAQRPGIGNTDFTQAAESTVNGVVSIKSYATPRNARGTRGASPFDDPLFEFFFGSPRRQEQPRRDDESQQQQTGLGSGVIITADGYIVTNNHVIDGAERIEVVLNDNRSFNATVTGTDPTTDLALVKIDAADLPVIPMGDSDALRVGEWVLAVGNPFGFTSTVTTGIVSAKARSISATTHSRRQGMNIEAYIQTDAAVNPGNSGGALVNLAGELVGINTAIYSNTGSYSGYSFAIPVSLVKKVVSDIRQYGAVQRALLGVTIADLTPQLAKEKGITAVTAGAMVMGVADRSSAKEAGLQEGDIITAISGHEVRDATQLIEQVNRYRPGDKVTVTYYRDNSEHSVTLTLLNNRGNTALTQASDLADLGCAFTPLSADMCRQLRLSQGVQVSGLKDGRFKSAGIKDGFIILDINSQRVATADDIERLYQAIVKSDSPVMFITGIYPTGRKMYYAVPLVDCDD